MALSTTLRHGHHFPKNRQFLPGGFDALSNFLIDERLRFSRAPVLLLEGHSFDAHNAPLRFAHGSNTTRTADLVATPDTMAGRHVHHVLAQQLGLQTLVTKPLLVAGSSGGGSGSVTFPTQTVLNEQLELAQRVGASTIVGVGNRATLDLAKALARTIDTRSHDHVFDELILVPHSYEGVLTSAHPYSLFLHSDQDVIVPQHILAEEQANATSTTSTTSITLPHTTVATLNYTFFEDKDIHGRFLYKRFLADAQQTALFASVALLFDSLKHHMNLNMHHHNQNNNSAMANDPRLKQAEALLQDFMDSAALVAQSDTTATSVATTQGSEEDDTRLTKEEVQERHDATVQFVYNVSQSFLEFGLVSDNNNNESNNDKMSTPTRSTPMAAAVSLLPDVFEDGDAVAESSDNKSHQYRNDDSLLLRVMAACAPALGRMHGMVLPQSPQPMLAKDPAETVDTLLRRVETNATYWQSCRDAPVDDLKRVLQTFCLLVDSEVEDSSSSAVSGKNTKKQFQRNTRRG